ncbi:uncharacterized protein LOC144338058 [Macaca mulatta]
MTLRIPHPSGPRTGPCKRACNAIPGERKCGPRRLPDSHSSGRGAESTGAAAPGDARALDRVPWGRRAHLSWLPARPSRWAGGGWLPRVCPGREARERKVSRASAFGPRFPPGICDLGVRHPRDLATLRGPCDPGARLAFAWERVECPACIACSSLLITTVD